MFPSKTWPAAVLPGAAAEFFSFGDERGRDLGQAAARLQDQQHGGPGAVGVEEPAADRRPVVGEVAVRQRVMADHVGALGEDLPDERGGPLRAEVHRVAGLQDAGPAPLGQQPAQAGGGVGDVLPPVRGGLAVVRLPGVFRLGAVPGLVRSAGCQPAAGQPGGLQPELLAGRGQERLGGLVQGRVAVGQAEVGGQVFPLVVPAGGQVGDRVQARDRGVGAGDAVQQLLVELPAAAASPICQYTAARPCRRPRSPAWRSAASGAAGCGEGALTGPAPSRLPRSRPRRRG